MTLSMIKNAFSRLGMVRTRCNFQHFGSFHNHRRNAYFAFYSTQNEPSSENINYVKLRMPDLSFQDHTPGNILKKWHVQEGHKLQKGDRICEIETADLLFEMESEDESYLAKIVTPQGTSDIKAGTTLALLVYDEVKDIPENVAETETMDGDKFDKTEVSADGANVLKLLHKLSKDISCFTEKELKTLKSLARNNDERLLNIYKASFVDILSIETLDRDYFVQNAKELVDEIVGANP